MKVLFTTQPGLGHLHPLTPLACALQKAGHQVAFACAQSFVPRVEAAGLTAFAAGLDWLESQADQIFPEMRGLGPQERTAFLTEIFVDTAANKMTYDLLALCEQWQPDLIVREETEYGGCIAAECLQIPHAVVSIGFFVPEYITKLVLEEPLAYLRSAYNLEPFPALAMLHRYLYLSYIPPGYQFPEYTLPPVAFAMQPFLLEHTREASVPTWMYDLPDQPTVYVSLGTVLREPRTLEVILQGLAAEPINIIATLGGGLEPAEFGPQPPNVRIERYIPQDTALMPHCDLIVTHGGTSTTLAALSQGVPVIIIPFGGHMLQHAVRCKALGVGLALKPSEQDEDFLLLLQDQSPLLTVETIRDAARTLLTDPGYRQTARQLQAEFQTQLGASQVVALLERLAVERAPLLRKEIE